MVKRTQIRHEYAAAPAKGYWYTRISPVTPAPAADAVRHEAVQRATGAPAALSGVEEAMRQASVTDDPLGRLAGEQLAIRGKRLRATLTLEAFSTTTTTAPSHDAQWAAAAVELVHQASLIHDDLTDEDNERRGQSAVWHAHGPDNALLLGDHFLAAAFDAAARSRTDGAVVREFAAAVREAANGQAAEGRRDAITATTDRLADYERRVRAKSGALMALPVVAGLQVAGAPSDRIKAARAAWRAVGAAYQVGDDLAELEGRKTGRSRQSDLEQRRLSAPVVHWLEQTSADEAAALLAFLSQPAGVSADIGAWRRSLLDSSAPAACRAHQGELLREARRAGANLPEAERTLLERTIERIARVDTRTSPTAGA
jgi:geranylgeranyl pyrophosphate synthase